MKPRTHRFFRAITLVVACLITIAALVIAIENWRGKRAWETTQREIEASGEMLVFEQFIPPAIPDQQNFLMTPLLGKLFEPDECAYARKLNERLTLGDPTRKSPGFGHWPTARHVELEKWIAHLGQSDLRQALRKHDAEMEEIAAASRRPFSRAPLSYEGNLFSTAVPHLQTLRESSRLFALRAEVALAQGRPDAALEDIVTLLRLAESQKNEPFLITQLIRQALVQQAIQVVWEGQSAHRFADSHLVTLQEEFETLDLVNGMAVSLRAERAAMTQYLSSLLNDAWVYQSGMPVKVADLGDQPMPRFGRVHSALTPRCVIYQNLVSANRLYQRANLTAIAKNRVYPEKIKAAENAYLTHDRSFPPYTLFTRAMIPQFAASIKRGAFTQTACIQAAVACALERHRLAHGEYPESLDSLVPGYLQKVPHDILTGESLKYRRNGSGGFVLYSLGWNETDDGGTLAANESEAKDLAKGDWVWPVKGSE